MMTVAIFLNGNPLVAKSVVNEGFNSDTGKHSYRLDSGEVILHDRDAGAIALAIEMLKYIRNDEPNRMIPQPIHDPMCDVDPVKLAWKRTIPKGATAHVCGKCAERLGLEEIKVVGS